PLELRFQRPLPVIPDGWRQWIARSKLLGLPDPAIVEVLVTNGYRREVAAAEVEDAAAHPYLRAALALQKPLRRAHSLLNALSDSSRLDPGAHSVERRKALSREEFRDRYYAVNRPVIIEHLMT